MTPIQGPRRSRGSQPHNCEVGGRETNLAEGNCTASAAVVSYTAIVSRALLPQANEQSESIVMRAFPN